MGFIKFAPWLRCAALFHLMHGRWMMLRGARDVDLSAAEEAADSAAAFEEKALYHGLKEAAIEGLVSQAVHPEVKLQARHGANIQAAIASAMRMMQTDSTVCGPYALVKCRKRCRKKWIKCSAISTLHNALLKLDGLKRLFILLTMTGFLGFHSRRRY